MSQSIRANGAHSARAARRALGYALVLLGLGVGAGCARAGVAAASRGPAPHDVSVPCNGSYNCSLPNPYPCEARYEGGWNRLAHRDDPDDCSFSIRENTVLYDGHGTARGVVTGYTRGVFHPLQVRINYGQRKQLPDGTTVVYAWDVETTHGGMSGWIRESDVTEDLSYMKTAEARDPGQGDYPEAWLVTGGTPEARAHYEDMALHRPHHGKLCNHRPNHYLLRPDTAVNVLYALPGNGGVSNDTYLPGVVFHRARGVPIRSVPYYRRTTNPNEPVAGYMEFMYGSIDGRYGWIAREAVRPLAS
ncbi:MAG TPA: hypothetical protein VFL93_07585 [Longimicrobiaceae bacterium]|nr:hypothetical protein [Longimicrobiaceae bacterium]